MNLHKKLFTGSALQTLNLLFDIGIGFLMMPFLIQNLGEKWYGLWLLIGSLISFFGLLTLGLSSAVQRYLSTENSNNKIHEYNQTLNSSLAVFIIAAFVAIMIAIILSFLPSLFVTDIGLIESFQYLIIFMGLTMAVSFLAIPFRAVLIAEYRFQVTSGAELVTLLLKSGLIFYFVSMNYGVIYLGVATFIGTILGKSILVIFAIKLTKKIKFSFSFITKNKLITLFKFSSKTMLVWLGDILRFSIDNIVITTFVGLSAVTIYSLPLRLFNYVAQFLVTSLSVLQPFFSEKVGEKNNQAIRHKFELACGIAFALGALFASGLFVFGYELISLWVGEYEEVQTLIYIFPIMILLSTSQNPCLLILYSHNKHEYYAYQNIAEGLLNAITSLIAVRYFGIIGVALGSLLPMLITKLFYQPRLTCRLIEFPLLSYYKQMITCYSFVLIATIIATYIKPEINTWLELLLYSSLFGLCFIPLYWLIALNQTTKEFIYIKLKRNKR